jgi:hypothetical protein
VTPNKWAKYMTPEEQTNHAISEALVNVPILCSLVGREFRNKDVLAAVAAAEKLGEFADQLRWRLKDFANFIKEPMGG